MDILKALKQIGEAVRTEVPNINIGGCCVFAAAAFNHLKDLGLKPKIRVADPDAPPKALGVVRKSIDPTDIEQWNVNGVWLGHVILEFSYDGKKYFFDSTGVAERNGRREPFLGYDLFRGSLSFKEANEMASVSRGWNPRFHRSDIPTMKSLLDENFGRLKDSIEKGKAFKTTRSSLMKEMKEMKAAFAKIDDMFQRAMVPSLRG